MRKDWVLTQEAFDAFLNWLSPDRDEAAAKYEKIRQKLIAYFDYKGCDNAELLADETINRVTDRLFRAEAADKTFPIQFLYGVAKNIFYEYCSEPKKFVPEQDLEAESAIVSEESYFDENLQRCMKLCLKELKPPELELILAYFQVNKKTKQPEREALCRKRGESMNATRVKVSRIKYKLQNCRNNCLKVKK